MADSPRRKLVTAALTAALSAALSLGLTAPAAADKPFLADSGSAPQAAGGGKSADRDRSGEPERQQGSSERCGGWGSKTDTDPMAPPEDPELGKCGRCFGGDD